MHNPLYDGGTIGDMIATAVARHAGRVAFIDGARHITYAELGRQIGQAMAWLQSLGLRKGDTVAQLARNRPEVFVLMAANYLLGLRSVTLHALGSAEDHATILNDAQATVFVADASYAAHAVALRAGCPGVRHWCAFDADDVAHGLAGFAAAAAALAPLPLVSQADAGDIIRLAYTGGTTGRPKGVMLSNRAVVTQALLMLAARDLPRDIRFLCPTPISHGAGALIVPCLWRGGTLVLQQGFDPARFLDALQQHRATLTFLVPTMVYALLDHPDLRARDLSSLQALMYGAAPMAPARIAEAMQVFGPILSQSFGQTEAPSNILLLTQADHQRGGAVLASAGRPYPGVRVALLDDAGAPVPPGQVGEICVRGPLVMDGYWQQPALTAEALRGGWLHTGDMACEDADGYFHLVDRKKDMLITGGFNVYPREIEDLLATHPAVAACAVIGVPDARWGEAVKAVVVLRAGQQAQAEELMALVRTRKGPVHTPKSIDFVEALPLTPLGKPDKKALRQRYWQGQARHVH